MRRAAASGSLRGGSVRQLAARGRCRRGSPAAPAAHVWLRPIPAAPLLAVPPLRSTSAALLLHLRRPIRRQPCSSTPN
uniref:Uncharacterized protein n=1 Tax=Setaria italica TaxID=4555 RepID=K3YNS4_SETIT